MHFHVITLFPDSIKTYVNESILGRAVRSKKLKISFYNPRDFTQGSKKKAEGSYKRVDHKPYGGGPGMVMEADPILRAVSKAVGNKKKVKIIFFGPSGKQFNTKYAKTVSKKYNHIVLIAGHYEGIDARVKKILRAEEISIGPYTLTGGEVPAMVIIDTLARQIPGILGNTDSLEETRIASSEVYTRPEVVTHKGKKYRVPKVLLSGHHKKIEEWRQKRR